MSLQVTEAVILKFFNWSESSRTVVFFSKDQGRLALVDKGGRRINSKRGRLIQFARLEITYYSSHKESNGYISDINVLETFSLDKEGSLGRLAYGSAACELLYTILSEQQVQPDLYNYFISFLKIIENSGKNTLPVAFLTFFIHLLSYLGYHPSLTNCVVCSKKIDLSQNDNTPVTFSPERGGIVCNACQKSGEYYIQLLPDEYSNLVELQRLSLSKALGLTIGYQKATGLLEVLTKFASFQTGLKLDLKSIEFLRKLEK
jgi:DNA repair protein RecO (recombination protein O)